MTKDILIFGSIRHINFHYIQDNKNMVLGVREELARRLYPGSSFDVIPYEDENLAYIIIFYNEMEEGTRNSIDSDMAFLLTGDDKDYVSLPFPFLSREEYKTFTADEFGDIWEKNSVEMGGDPFILEEIRYTANGMYVKVKFV